VPPVVKHFAWKVCNNILPTKVNLFAKKIVQDPFCQFCLREEENIVHLLWFCPSSMAVWQECSKRIQKMAFEVTDGRGLVEGWWQRLEGVDFVFALSVARKQWLRRNAYIFENFFMPPLQVIHKVKAIIEYFDGANAKMENERRLPGPGHVRWQKPPVGIMKINWDAALHKENKHMGVGVVIRDDKGDVVVALSKIVPYIMDPLTAETVVVWHVAEQLYLRSKGKIID
jgi:hypothetical protein